MAGMPHTLPLALHSDTRRSAVMCACVRSPQGAQAISHGVSVATPLS